MVHSLLGNETTENKENDFSEKKNDKKKEIMMRFLTCFALNYKKNQRVNKVKPNLDHHLLMMFVLDELV